MALKLKIKTEENHHVHFDTCVNSYTLCGLETGGDKGIGISVGVRTTQKVDCPDCIRIVKFCKPILESEFKKTV
jgi:hypothetical protein